MKPTDEQIIEHMPKGPELTYVIGNKLKASGFPVSTACVLRRVKAMAKAGRVEKVQNWVNPTSHMAMWKPVAAPKPGGE